MNLRIRDELQSLKDYRPNPLIPGPWLKLLLIFRPKKPFNFFTRRIHQFKDGGRVAIDFYPPLVPSSLKNPSAQEMGRDTPEMAGKWELTNFPSGQGPLVIIVPGLSGTSTEGYLTSACEELWNSKLKIRSVIVNRRGYSGVELTGPHPMSWIRWEDVEDIIYWLRTVRKEKHIFIYGASLGGNYAHWHSGRTAELQNGATLRHDFGEGHLVDDYPHLIAQGHKKGTRVTSLGELASVDGFIAVSAPFDMAACRTRQEQYPIIDRILKSGLVKTCVSLHHSKYFQSHMSKSGVLYDDIISSLNYRDFDNRITCKWYGLKSGEEYYNYFSGNRRLKVINKPSLFISSMSDPIIDTEAQDRQAIQSNDNLYCLNIRDGEHVTYPHGLSNRNYAAMVAARWIETLLEFKAIPT